MESMRVQRKAANKGVEHKPVPEENQTLAHGTLCVCLLPLRQGIGAFIFGELECLYTPKHSTSG